MSLLAPHHLLGFRSLDLPLELRFLRMRVLGGEMQTLACFALDLHGFGLLHRARDLRGGELRAGTCHACCELGGGAGSRGFAFCAGFGARDGFGGGAGVEEGAGGGEGRETEEEDVFDEHGGTGPGMRVKVKWWIGWMKEWKGGWNNQRECISTVMKVKNDEFPSSESKR